jgi:hypothetical protein
LEGKFAGSVVFVFIFMIFHWFKVSIGGLDYGKMNSYCHLKASSLIVEGRRGREKYSMSGLSVKRNIVLI